MARQSADKIRLDIVGQKVTVYWWRNNGEGCITGTVMGVWRVVEEKIMVGFDVVRVICSTEIDVDGVRVPCDEWEVAE